MSAPIPAPPVPFAIPILQVRPLLDPVIDQLGYDLRSPYVERFWLSSLGPSTMLLLRRVADGFDQAPDGYELDLADAATGLGLAARGGRHSPFMRALTRTTKFGLARLHGDTFEVRRRIPPLNLAQLSRLPERLRNEHLHWQTTNGSHQVPANHRERARRLALSLLETGDDLGTVERRLHRWQFHPALAHDAVRWAAQQAGLERPRAAS